MDPWIKGTNRVLDVQREDGANSHPGPLAHARMCIVGKCPHIVQHAIDGVPGMALAWLGLAQAWLGLPQAGLLHRAMAHHVSGDPTREVGWMLRKGLDRGIADFFAHDARGFDQFLDDAAGVLHGVRAVERKPWLNCAKVRREIDSEEFRESA